MKAVADTLGGLEPAHIARGNASCARIRVAVERIFPLQKCRLGLVIRP